MSETLRDAFQRGAAPNKERARLRLAEFRENPETEALLERMAKDPALDRSIPPSHRLGLAHYAEAKRKAAEATELLGGDAA